MMGIQRVLEGTDWPVCSAVHCVGMPGSLNTVVQFLGRAMRLKGEDYPADQRDRQQEQTSVFGRIHRRDLTAAASPVSMRASGALPIGAALC